MSVHSKIREGEARPTAWRSAVSGTISPREKPALTLRFAEPDKSDLAQGGTRHPWPDSKGAGPGVRWRSSVIECGLTALTVMA